MEFKKGDLILSENKSDEGIIKKILSKFKDIKKKAKSELKETTALIRILTHAVKSYSKNREFDLDKKDIEFIKGQSADVIKNLLMVVISIIPIPIPVTPFLIIFGKKIGIDIVPKEHEIPEKGKKKDNIDESIITEASKKKVLMDKVGLSEENAEQLERVCGSLSVWMANKVIDYQMKTMKSWIGFDESELTKERALEKINSGNMMNFYGSLVTEIMDWIRIGINGDVNEYKNLSLMELGEESKRWHDSLNVGGGDINYKEKGDIVLDFRDSDGEGYYWVNTGTNDCNEESKRMGHCGRTNSSNTIWSLRSVKKLKDTYTINNSVVTAAIGNNDGFIWQMKGPKNSKPKKELHKYIIPLFYLTGEDNYVIKGFGREYNSKNDFQIGDLDNNEIKELYQNRPDLFNDYRTKKLLIDLGVIDKNELLTSFIINIEPHQLRNFLGNDRKWGKDTTFYEQILIEPWDFWNNWEYYDPEDLIGDVNDVNIEDIKKILSKESGEDLRDTPIDELLEYDGFENVGDALRRAANTVDGDAYGDYLYGCLKSALETYGKVLEMNTEGIELEVDISLIDDIDDEALSVFMERCDDDIECAFMEAIYEGYIDIPKPSFSDDWYNSNFDERYFNEMLSDNLSEYL
jgi:hypothetical protein